MSDKSFTIKQIADELGVSKTTVRKIIENLGLRSSLRKNGNQFAINENQKNMIKSAFLGDKSETKTQTKTETSSQSQTSEISDLVAILKAELRAKDEQIERLHKLLDQEQQLRMVTEQKILQLEDKQNNDEAPTRRFRFSLFRRKDK